MMGGTIIAFVGGIHHWWPKMFGVMYSEKWGKIAALFIFVGFNMTFFNQFVLGQQGMPRRYWSYVPQFQQQHVLSTIGSYLLLAGFTLIAVYLVHSLRNGKKVGPNPWGAQSLEWTHTASPPIEHNFHGQPRVENDPYNFPEIDRTGATDAH